MKVRYILQAIALIFAIALITILSLAIAGKISFLWFWIIAALALFVSYLLHGSKKH